MFRSQIPVVITAINSSDEKLLKAQHNRAQERARLYFWILEVYVPDKEPSAAENFGDVVEEDQESQVDLGNPKQ